MKVYQLEGNEVAVGALARETPQELVCRVYEAERITVYRYLSSLGIDPADAQELTQEVFLKLYLEVRKGTQIRTLRAWLFAVASNLALNHVRAQGFRPLAWDPRGDWAESLADQHASPETAMLRREKVTALLQALSTLSPQQQVCLHLRAEGFRYREIAEAVGVAVPTVSEFIRRAVMRLRKVIDG